MPSGIEGGAKVSSKSPEDIRHVSSSRSCFTPHPALVSGPSCNFAATARAHVVGPRLQHSKKKTDTLVLTILPPSLLLQQPVLRRQPRNLPPPRRRIDSTTHAALRSSCQIPAHGKPCRAECAPLELRHTRQRPLLCPSNKDQASQLKWSPVQTHGRLATHMSKI